MEIAKREGVETTDKCSLEKERDIYRDTNRKREIERQYQRNKETERAK